MAKKNVFTPPKTREERLAAIAKRKKQKKQQKIMAGVGALGVLAVVFMALQPRTGPIQFAVCRTFAEMQIAYPQTLAVREIEQIDRVTRLYYSYTDPFGQLRSDELECRFYIDPNSHQLGLESAMLNREPVDQDKVDAFSHTIPAVIAAKPDLSIPPETDDSNLVDLRQDD